MTTKKLKKATTKTTKQTTTTKKPSQPKTTKANKPQIGQNSNPFVDSYLEFYDDIKIPTRRYDW